MTARSIARPLALLAGVAVFVAACGGGASQAPGATTTVTATQAPIATQVPLATEGAFSSFALPSFHSDVQLEELFPDEIAGQKMTVLSMAGSEFMSEGSSPELDAALVALGKQASDLSVAFGSAGTITIIAFQVDGAPGAQILSEIFKAYQEDTAASITDLTLGGKSVKKVVSTDTGQGTSYIYSAQDVVFAVGGLNVTDAALNEAFSKLP